MCQILSSFISQCHCVHLHIQYLHLPGTNFLTFPSFSLPFHNISSSVPSNALDIQHFYKPFPVTTDEMLFHAVINQQLNNTFVLLVLWTYLIPWRFTIFSTDSVNGVQNLSTCFVVFYIVSVVWSIWVLGQECISTSYCFSGAQWLRMSQSQGYTSLGASLLLKNYTMGSVPKKDKKKDCFS